MSGSIESYATSAGRKWMVRYRDESGRQRKKKALPTKRAATLYLADLQVKQARGEWIDPNAGKVTVGMLYDSWRAGQGHAKATTLHNLELNWARHVQPRWGSVEIGKIRPSAVRGWITEMSTPVPKLSEGEPVRDEHGTIVMTAVGVPTIERAFGILRQILTLAVQDRLIPSNPAAGVKLPKRQHNSRGYLTHQQVELLAEQVGDDRLVIQFLAYTGLRWGEMAALRVRDFDMLRRRVNITEAVAEVKGKVVWSSPKTHERRTVPFPAFLAEPLAQLMRGRGREDLVFGNGKAVLRVSNWRPRVFNKAIAKLCRFDEDGVPTTSFPKVSPHDLRHTAASLAISAGANVKAVQTMLGHASAAMTLDTYADLFPDDLEVVADALQRQREQALGGHAGRALGVPSGS
ncbi:tyrosine-type recombinase/integrase [Jongsikchunia kroppenstedtii]|uniref:tyrosine-type recombinase/integrase n=1 Tax=Jongsikchunia kroppenstedtii TaxID=1121721 RepID=UPI000371C5D4|nr:site-specific integrase [Jongsikchunia kroppenstedtii]